MLIMIKFIAEECKEKEDHIHRLGDYCSETARKLQQAQERLTVAQDEIEYLREFDTSFDMYIL